MSESNRLFLVPTPLGNLADLAPRSREILESVSTLFCEDTRTTSRLLAKLELKSPRLVALHDHNERKRVDQVLRALEQGDVGLVSEAGTPVVSDPGFVVVRAACEAGVDIVSVPGPCAAIAAVVGSGLPADRFTFVGFPPRSSGKRVTWLGDLKAVEASLVLYEAPRRVLGLLDDMVSVFGDRRVALAVNLSKKGERFVRGTASEVAAMLRAEDEVRGEMTLVVAGAEADDAQAWVVAEGLMDILVPAGVPVGAVRDAVVLATGLPKRAVYQRVLERSE